MTSFLFLDNIEKNHEQFKLSFEYLENFLKMEHFKNMIVQRRQKSISWSWGFIILQIYQQNVNHFESKIKYWAWCWSKQFDT